MTARASRPVALLAVLLAAAPAFAEDAPPVLQPRNLELLPLTDLERLELARDHPDVAARVQHLAGRLRKLREHLRGRPHPDDAGGEALRAQIRQTEADLAPFLARIREACREHHLTDALLRRMDATPDGPRRTERYARGLVLFVLSEGDPHRALFERVVPAVDGAVLGLDAFKARRLAALEKADAAPDARRREGEAFDRQVRAIEKRFWRLVDYVVPREQRAALHHVLPTVAQKHEDILAHLFALPGLSASQGMRLKGVLTEFEAESAPDTALGRRLEQALADPSLGGAQRARVRRERAEARDRVTALLRAATEAARSILTPAQWTALEAIPPRVSVGDRRQTSPQVLEGVEGVDRARLEALRRELVEVRSAIREKRLAAAARGRDYGPDSPQTMGMQMAMANVEAEANALQREFNGRVFRELLTPEQVVQWVIDPR